MKYLFCIFYIIQTINAFTPLRYININSNNFNNVYSISNKKHILYSHNKNWTTPIGYILESQKKKIIDNINDNMKYFDEYEFYNVYQETENTKLINTKIDIIIDEIHFLKNIIKEIKLNNNNKLDIGCSEKTMKLIQKIEEDINKKNLGCSEKTMKLIKKIEEDTKKIELENSEKIMKLIQKIEEDIKKNRR